MVEFAASGFKPAKHIMGELESLLAIDCTKIHNWRSIRGLLNRLQRFGPRFAQVIKDFRCASVQKKRAVLKQLSGWMAGRGTVSSYWTIYTDWRKSGQGYVLVNDKRLPACWNS